MTNTPVSLEAGLRDMAQRFKLDAEKLIRYAAETPYADNRFWPEATGTPCERRVWYALTRVLQPSYVVECGTNWGCSTTQILSALDANRHGKLDAVDLLTTTEGHPIGARIPAHVRTRLTLNLGVDAADWLDSVLQPINLFFEDTDHTRPTTERIYRAVKPRLAPGAVTISHDAYRPEVPEGVIAAGMKNAVSYFFEETPSFGLVIWRNL